jgi:hypothetical protein
LIEVIVKTGKDDNPITVPITSAVREMLWPLRELIQFMSLLMSPNARARDAAEVIVTQSPVTA